THNGPSPGPVVHAAGVHLGPHTHSNFENYLANQARLEQQRSNGEPAAWSDAVTHGDLPYLDRLAHPRSAGIRCTSSRSSPGGRCHKSDELRQVPDSLPAREDLRSPSNPRDILAGRGLINWSKPT